MRGVSKSFEKKGGLARLMAAKAIKADMAIINGKVITVDKNFSIRETIAVRDGKIIAVGRNDDVKGVIGPKTEVLDLKGKTVLPGINDSHLHGASLGGIKPPLGLDLSYPKVKSIRDIADELRRKIETVHKGEWIRGFGWDPGYLEECKSDPRRIPRKWDVDPVSPDNPVVLTDFSFHNLLANSKALEMAGISKETPDPEGGEIERDPDTGEPTGIFKELSAIGLVSKVIPPYTRDQKREAILSAMRELNAEGITSFTEPGLGPGGDAFQGGLMGRDCSDIYRELHNEKKLTARVNIMLLFGEYGGLSFKDLQEGLWNYQVIPGLDREWLRIAQVKIFADGIPPTKTAWMYEEYRSGGNGQLVFRGKTEQDRYNELMDMIAYAHNHRFQVGIHATGDRAIDACVEGYVRATEKDPWDARHYVIHGDFTTQESITRMAAYKIGANVQTVVKWTISDYMENLIGKERSAWQWPLRSMLDAGVHIAASSDAPTMPIDWKLGIQAAVLRESKATGRVSGPEQRISREEAIHAYTMGGAWQDHMDQVKGSIEEGKLGDFCILDGDILSVEAHEIKDIRNLITVVGGRIVYDAR